MLIISPSTAAALAPHATEKSWVMFVQVNPPGGGPGPIKIEGVRGQQIDTRMRAIAADNPFDTMLIGLVPTANPTEVSSAIAAQYATSHLHDGWHAATADLLAYVQHHAQSAIQELLARAHPGGLSEAPVDIEGMAKILGCSVPTVHRMKDAGKIPYLRFGRLLRFVPADVLASLNRHRR